MPDISSSARDRPLLGRLSLCVKAARLIGHVLLGLVLMPSVPLIGKRSWALVRWWHGRMLRVLNVKLEVEGEPVAGPALIVANHSSWLDIIVLGHVFNASFVSKAEIGAWPMIGAFARAAGTLGNGETSGNANGTPYSRAIRRR